MSQFNSYIDSISAIIENLNDTRMFSFLAIFIAIMSIIFVVLF